MANDLDGSVDNIFVLINPMVLRTQNNCREIRVISVSLCKGHVTLYSVPKENTPVLRIAYDKQLVTLCNRIGHWCVMHAAVRKPVAGRGVFSFGTEYRTFLTCFKINFFKKNFSSFFYI